MGLDIIFVVVIVALAALFMGRRLYRIIRNRGGCACNCDKADKGVCDGAACPGAQTMKEIVPQKKD